MIFFFFPYIKAPLSFNFTLEIFSTSFISIFHLYFSFLDSFILPLSLFLPSIPLNPFLPPSLFSLSFPISSPFVFLSLFVVYFLSVVFVEVLLSFVGGLCKRAAVLFIVQLTFKMCPEIAKVELLNKTQ